MQNLIVSSLHCSVSVSLTCQGKLCVLGVRLGKGSGRSKSFLTSFSDPVTNS